MRLATALLIPWMTIVACSSDQSGTVATPTPVHTVTASVTGNPWTMTNVRAVYLPASGTVLLNAVDSLHSPATDITLYLDGISTWGVYTPQNNATMVVDFTRNDSTWDTLLGKLGSIRITAISATRIAGSFDIRVNLDPALTAADSATTLTVTGQFDVAIP